MGIFYVNYICCDPIFEIPAKIIIAASDWMRQVLSLTITCCFKYINNIREL